MAKNPLIRKKEKSYTTPMKNQSAGILDDFAVRKVVATKEGSITRTPTDDIDITNKKYVDDAVAGGGGGFAANTILVLDGAVSTLNGNVLILT